MSVFQIIQFMYGRLYEIESNSRLFCFNAKQHVIIWSKAIFLTSYLCVL